MFAALRIDINAILKHTLHNMITKGSEKAELKMSLKITLNNVEVVGEEQKFLPSFESKVSSILQYKTEKENFFGGHDYELAWNPDLMEYVMQPTQESLFEDKED